MARAKLGEMQIRHTLLDAEGLSSRANPNKESIQYRVVTRVISSLRKLARIEHNGITLILLALEVTAIMKVIMTSK